ncbi:MAG: hypothetical protein ACOYN4_15295, partial [Bacteroidales bacterium]
LFQNASFIYDDERFYGNSNPTLNEFDIRNFEKYEDENGIETSRGKKVTVSPGSKWLCSNVTLMKPSYDIYYILENDKGEQIALSKLNGFISTNDYLKRAADKKLQKEQLLANQKREEMIKLENERISFEKRRLECIAEFGQQNGELIAQGNVKIGMTIKMCKSSWGEPYTKSKSTTVDSTYENWFYRYGLSLHFTDGFLTRIEE